MDDLSLGFIDYIVTPTLTVCGDMVTAVLGGTGGVEQPWYSTLAVNREKWQEKVVGAYFIEKV